MNPFFLESNTVVSRNQAHQMDDRKSGQNNGCELLPFDVKQLLNLFHYDIARYNKILYDTQSVVNDFLCIL